MCSMRPIQELTRIKRPAFIKDNSVPYLSFGKGLTPSKQDSIVTLLAVAWDFFIQLFYFDDDQRCFKMDGVLINDCEIVMCCFTSDSVMMIADTSAKLKMVYTRKFCTGDYLQDEILELRDFSKYAELDKR